MLFCYVPFFLSLRGLIVKFNNRTMNDDFIKTFCLKDFYDERHNMPEGSYLTEDFVLIRDLDNLPYHDGVFRFDFVVFFFKAHDKKKGNVLNEKSPHRSSGLFHSAGRGERIRTSDLFVPNEAR